VVYVQRAESELAAMRKKLGHIKKNGLMDDILEEELKHTKARGRALARRRL